MNKYLVTILKFALAAAIIAWLVNNLDPDQLTKLRQRSIDWPRLAAGFGLSLVAVCITFVRWQLLVRAISIPFSLADAFRLGFLGYLLNFVSVGLVGGDLFKAIFIARQQPGRRPEAVATVIVDRVLGLYALLVVTSLAILIGDISQVSATVQFICNATLTVTVIGGVGILLVLSPLLTSNRLATLVEKIPLVGGPAARMINAVAIYRTRPLIMVVTGVLSLLVHSTLAVAVFLTASALFDSIPTISEHLVIVPLSLVAGALPFTPAGMGTFEAAMEQLYSLVPAVTSGGDGLIVALAYRLITIAIAAVGGIYFVMARREVREILDEAAASVDPSDKEKTHLASTG